VSTWLSIGGWVCVIATMVGLVLSFMVLRKKSYSRGIRGIAWSLIPLAAYLTHAITLIGQIGSAVVQFAGSFVFSSRTWLGVVLLGISVLLFLASGGIPVLRRNRQRKDGARTPGSSDAGGHAGAPAPPARGQAGAPAPPARGQAHAPPPEDDLGDVQELLRRRGIN
jgi:hypothetical protein